jgi:long-chain fatty acid transport protein
MGLYSNGLNVNGTGSKANSMGGAFIGLADDYSAVFWNPAGLIQMDTSNLAIMGDIVIPKMTYEFALAGIDATSKSKIYPIPFAGYFKVLSPKAVVGFAIYAPSGIGAAWNGADLKNLTAPDPTAYKWESMVMAVTAAPTFAYKFSSKFSIGVALNLNYGMLNEDMPAIGQYTERIKGMGFGATIGALFKPAKLLSIGVSYRTPSKIKLSGTAEMPGAAALGLAGESDIDREITWPQWIGVGIALKPTPKLTITADAQYTNWGKMKTVAATFDAASWKAALPPLGGLSLENMFTMDLQWEDATQIRFGIEYLIKKCLALRGGYYIDPAPGPLNRLNIMLPSPDGSWLTFGLGLMKAKFNLDFSVEYNVGGKDRVATADPKAMPGTHGASILAVGFGLTLKL